MRTPPPDLDVTKIVSALSRNWSIGPVVLDYIPLGLGSHHWVAECPNGTRRFITIDDLTSTHLGARPDNAFTRLTRAFRTAWQLHDCAHLPFVIAPMEGRSGVTYRLDDRYSMAVFPFLDVEPSEYGEFRREEDRQEAMRCVGLVHNATQAVNTRGLRTDTLAFPERTLLEAALESANQSWESGPYGEPARLLLQERASHILGKVSRFDDLVNSVTADASELVITHGEPHASNFIRTRSGELVAVDWDTVALAPRERDLWMLVNDDHGDWSSYQDVTGVQSLSTDALKAYRLQWDLTEIATYMDWFRKPHERTEEVEIAWKELPQYLES